MSQPTEEYCEALLPFLHPAAREYCEICIRVLKPWAALEYIEGYLIETAERIIACG